MTNNKDALKQRLLQAFRDEALERLQTLEDALARIQQSPGSVDADIESVFREVHSLKGAARAVGLTRIEQLCQVWESLLSALKKQRLAPVDEHWSLSRQAVKTVRQMVREGGSAEPAQAETLRQAFAQALLGDATTRVKPAATVVSGQEAAGAAPESKDSVEPKPQTQAPSDPIEGQLRVSVQRLDGLLFHVEELQQLKLSLDELAVASGDDAHGFPVWRSNRHDLTAAARQLKNRIEDLDPGLRAPLQSVLDFTDWSGDFLEQWEYRVRQQSERLEGLARELVSVSDRMRREFQQLMVLPCRLLVEGIPAMVQDLADDLGKTIRLEVRGDDLQVDKRILDELRSPFQHLLRNAIDHGLETSELRRERGKDPVGRLSVTFSQETGETFELCVRDDGAGLVSDDLRERALASGLVTAEEAEAWTEEQLRQLIFMSGFSTSELITDLSGRGLGLAIVQEKVERLGGEVRVETRPGEGTAFVLRLPATLATYRALLVRTADQLVAIPAQVVERVLRLPAYEVAAMENRLTVTLDERVLPLWRLAELLELGGDTTIRAPQRLSLVVLRVGETTFALLVDEVLDDQEITVKSLGRQLKRVRNVLGATLLGDGRIVPLLHPQDLLKSARQTNAAPLHRGDGDEADATTRVLVAEDSVTSRGLLKAILESAGYEVVTAVDGLEGWALLKQSEFDLLVSDIEMPRLDGFALTERIRDDRHLKDLPVVLVTALQSAEDRERGLDAGANAYIVKSGFDQSNLLDVIRRLL